MQDLDLEVAPGERVLLLGPSGSGKSTLLAGLAGVLGSEEDGETVGELHVTGRAGLVLQDPETQLVMSRIGDEVAFGAENLGVPRDEIWRRVGEALDAVGLDVPLGRSTSALSGGQKQRLAMAGVLAMRPGLVLLDEPTANLDPGGARDVRDAVRDMLAATGATAVIVEHRIDLWLDLADRVVVLAADGTLLADGAPAEVLERRAAELRDAGVWLPGEPVEVVRGPGDGGAPLLAASALDVARAPGHPLGLRVDLDVRAGAVEVLAGPNGSGKTTLALTLAGLLPPASGSLVALPALAAGAGPEPIRWRSRDLLTRIGTVFQSPEHQFLASTVRDELAVGPRALGLGDAEVAARVDGLLDRLGLTALAEANPFTLSGGEKRRLSVATAIATGPRVVVLDEPTFGQDAKSWRALVGVLAASATDGVALVASSHDEAVAVALSARVTRLPGGRS